ncbi:MAG: hypothetical protein OEY72_05465, partial [Gammaproteobacteria bacterium]|nr:hypothetical protein [Gammaproteobacteria bacterium]
FRRYSLVVMPGPLDPGAVTSYLSKTGKSVDLGAAQSKIAASQSSNAAKTIEDIAALDDQVGSLSGHWLGLALGAEISELTERIAFSNAVTYAQSLPRIVIVSLETEPGNPAAYRSALDLRLDEVDAWPYPGQATRAAQHFQSARGLQNSMLEARFLERVLGLGESANTMNLVARAEGGQSGMLFFSPGQEADLNQIEGLSAYARRLIEQSLKAGREVVLSAQPVELAGRFRFGWWEHDPSTGRVVGVMDDGLHQATVGYSINTTKIGMNDDTGLVIGAIVGATTTEILIAAKILETGSMTPALVADIEKRIKSLLCMSCPEASSKGTIGATASTSCWKLEAKLDAGVGVKTTSFCEKYSAGFSCASSMILNGYKKAALTPKVEFKADWESKMPCE